VSLVRLLQYNRNDQKTMICGTRARALVRYLPGPRELGSELVLTMKPPGD